MTHDSAATVTDPQADLARAVASALEDRRLLTHPFYRRWEAGELSSAELAEYAVHYRAFEAALPEVLATVVDELTADGRTAAADMVARNLADELGRPDSHLTLFDGFAAALPDAPRATGPGAAARSLVDVYLSLAAESPVAALAGLAAYESQASEIAATKGDGLRRWYGMDAADTRFWDVHAAMDADHGDWAVEALALLGADTDEVADAARRAADAWWALLDERQTEGLAAA
ncbi:MAG: iron-containing redox enzyme family protein [Acidimicrobiales bacterium]|jgi:pyrroloquinoline-quinone synthase